MFVLDTNVLSAIMGARPVPEVARWIARQRDEDLFTTSVCQAEIAAGIAIMPQGQRREALTASAQAMFIADFRGRVLPFDTKAAESYAEIFAARRGAGYATPTIDLMIAAITRSNNATVVTRHTGWFTGCGIKLVDPWTS